MEPDRFINTENRRIHGQCNNYMRVGKWLQGNLPTPRCRQNYGGGMYPTDNERALMYEMTGCLACRRSTPSRPMLGHMHIINASLCGVCTYYGKCPASRCFRYSRGRSERQAIVSFIDLLPDSDIMISISILQLALTRISSARKNAA